MTSEIVIVKKLLAHLREKKESGVVYKDYAIGILAACQIVLSGEKDA